MARCRIKITVIIDGEPSTREYDKPHSVSNTEHRLRKEGYVYIGESKWASTNNGNIIIIEVITL